MNGIVNSIKDELWIKKITKVHLVIMWQDLERVEFMAMGKKWGILLTLTAIVSVIAIVGAIGATKCIIKSKKENLMPREGDKVISTMSVHLTLQTDSIVLAVNQQINKEEKLINDYATAYIQYNLDGSTELIDKELIASWITLKNGSIVLDEEKVKDFVERLALEHDTVGTERSFVNSHGKAVTVSGGPYGWKIDCDKETKELIDMINRGVKEKDREPVYKQKAFGRGKNDIGNTYVEINMSEQKMWYYKEGELIVSTNIVTGNTAKGNGTPSVVGYIHNKVRNTNLVGKGYVAFVHYWMKVYGSIGIHDASWRSKFGGSIYKINGSHGCINTPYEDVKTIFDNIEVGTPVIIFYEENSEEKSGE
jgi:hypothetical protein